MNYSHIKKQGLYDPQYEHDACGVGFVCNIKGQKSNKIVKQGLEVLDRLTHRGAVGADPKTGDGAGILIQMPHEFFMKIAPQANIDLPELGEYGTGIIFLPQDEKEREFCKGLLEKLIKQEGQELLGWREVPLDNLHIGQGAQESEPIILQVFIKSNIDTRRVGACPYCLDFERKLYIIRKQAETIVRESDLTQKSFFYITNLSCRTFSYKGLLMPYQVEKFFVDLQDEDMKSAIALVHSRYSTNTFPTWDLAQPFRFLAHNGEINTLRGNTNWMKAKEALLESELFGDDVKKLIPVLIEGASDSAILDNAFELLLLSGRSVAHSLLMLVPGAWENNKHMPEKLRDFYKYHACFMEPWDGPSAIVATDGTQIGAILDRNGLRPARYIITKDDSLVLASEVGVLDIEPENIVKSGRLEPGKILFIDTEKGEIINDDEVKETIANEQPYGEWLKEHMIEFDTLESPNAVPKKTENFIENLKSFGYSREDVKVLVAPMAQLGHEPTGSMGNDSPWAVLSPNPLVLYNYFKQLFAQVTNPAIDPIREEIVMSLQSFIGPQKNILVENPENCHKIRIKSPILTNDALSKIEHIDEKGYKTKVIPILFKAKEKKYFAKTLDEICKGSEKAIKQGCTSIILSDRGVNKDYAAIPALIAVGAVHHYLVKKKIRSQISIILESGEPREVHHFAVLFGYGVDCINPYLAYDLIEHLIQEQELNLDVDTAITNYRKAVAKGILKILSKIGISTIQSYRGAQIFEALGLAQDVIDKCFVGTTSRIGGVTLDTLAQETIARHEHGFGTDKEDSISGLAAGGVYQWKKDGEHHLWNPETIATLQDSVRRDDYSKFQEFASLINDQSKNPTTLRSLLKFKPTESIAIDQVESADEIFKRLATGAMSFGSISKGAHETLAIAMNRIGGQSNTGEGGEDSARFTPLPNGDSKRSAIKQVASGRFGVSTNYLVNADEIQIKIAQGAKPGEGGQLPGHKVSVTIAKTRYTTPGVTLISPPPHHDIYSIEDLAQLIFDLKNVNPAARISVKLVSEVGVGTIAAGVAKGHADMILISGADGGTGASPLSSLKHTGLPWELGLAETHQTLVLNDLRTRVRLQTDGQMRTGRDIAMAAILGAEEYGFCSSALIVMGCVMLRHCHLNNCSVGVATQDDILQEKFRGRPEHVVNYFQFVVQELREIMAQLGVKNINEMIGRTDLVELDNDIVPEKAKDIDYSKILYKPVGNGHAHSSGGESKDSGAVYCVQKQDHCIDDVLDRKLIEFAKPALEKGESVEGEFVIKNLNRTTGAMLSGEVCKRYGEGGLSEETIKIKFKGMAGQSFGAFLAKGVIFKLEGLGNDYVGKGISGGKIIVCPDEKVDYDSEKNIIIGNTTFYGAICGEAYIRGVAGERFCIRNSGLNAVVEGVGDHGCEYMTGGRVVILGETGRNFGAGMSGGIAYIYDADKTFKDKCNLSMVELEDLEEEDKETVHSLLFNHIEYTGSSLAKRILDDFAETHKHFVKVMPIEYKRILEQKKLEEELGVDESL